VTALAEEKISYAELLQIVQLIKSTPQFAEVHLKYGEIEIHLSRGTAQSESAAALIASSASMERTSPVAAPEPKPAATEVAARSDAQSSESTQSWPANSILVRSPMMGTFYRAPAPSAPPFVEIAQAVEPDTTVCIIEVMKLMSSIAAGVRGTITHILAENAELVEFGQIIMVIEPR
jgi:acetyl-CoA carboxylase biotin carboxyl carrier protein